MISDIKILFHQGKQYIPDVTTVEVPGIFRGRPVISSEPADVARLVEICPTGAISPDPVSIDMGKCVFCGECQFAFPGKIRFTKDYKISSGTREGLIIPEGRDEPVTVNPEIVRKEIRKYFRKSLKLRQVSAGGDNSCEWELNAPAM